ncbi:MAG: hypothetical protein IJ597_03520, partial [Synergistaceae bacterium]|nr:hypothetical protein [Synergistaceae bacterium]
RIYVKYFPTVYQEDNNFYFQYSDSMGVWNEISLLAIIRHFKQIVRRLVPDFWKAAFNKEIEVILPLVCKNLEDLEEATNVINLKNGLFSLATFELLSHNEKIFSTIQIPFLYAPEATCPNFKKFLDEIFLGDKALKKILQEAFGYGLSSQVAAQKFFLMYSAGSSGKSVVCDLLYHLAGGKEQVSTVALGDLGHKFQRSQLYGKIVNISTENEVRRLNTQALKAITAGDPVQLEMKGQNPFTDVISCKLFFAVNSLPIASDRTFSYMRRAQIIPFLARFVDNPAPNKPEELKRNPNIKDELLKELPGIFNWAMKGLRRLIDQDYKFTHSEKADEVLALYVREINPVCDFTNEVIEVNEKSEVTQDNLYEAYSVWAKRNGEKVDNKRSFLKDLRQNLNDAKIPFEERKSNSKRFFTGIALKNSSNRDINEI